MKAIILAAGYGNRMQPLTENKHKTLLEIDGETIIGKIIDGLVENNISEIVVGTGYRAEQLITYLTNRYKDISFTFIENERYRETNNIYSLALIFKSISIDQDILLIESDLIYEKEVIERIIKSPHSNVALVDKFRSGMDGTVVALTKDTITNIIPPHLQDDHFDFSDKYKTLNIYKFSNDFCNSIFKNLLIYYAQIINDNCYYELILGILIYMQSEKIYAEIIKDEKWAEVDDPNDLNVADFVFSSNKVKILNDSFGGYWNHDIIDFCFIRNMYFPNNSILSEVKSNLNNLMYNYGSRQQILNRKLSYFIGCEEEYVVLLNGASQIYPLLKTVFENKNVCIPIPTFGEYNRIFPNASFYRDNFMFDKNEVDNAIINNDVVVFVNPNNPTGTTFYSNDIVKYAESYPDKYFIVDESFIEFSDQKSILADVEKKQLKNVLIIKSLSKNLGVPGVRLGYVYSCDKEFVKKVLAYLPIWNINSIAEFFIELLLKHKKALQNSYEQTIEDRKAFMLQLQKIKYLEEVYDSGGNFFVIRFKKEFGNNLQETFLSKYSIFYKDVSDKFNNANYYIRLAVRTPNENAKFASLLESELEQMSENSLIKI